jgi:hypothetical protein
MYKIETNTNTVEPDNNNSSEIYGTKQKQIQIQPTNNVCGMKKQSIDE